MIFKDEILIILIKYSPQDIKWHEVYSLKMTNVSVRELKQKFRTVY